jgi:uncharacterized protein YybS (DUF2232 family)
LGFGWGFLLYQHSFFVMEGYFLTDEYRPQDETATQEAYQPEEPSRQPRPNPVRRLTEGALMVALAVILGMLSFYMPLLNMIFLMIWPIPICFLIKKYGLPFGILAFLVASVLLAFFMGAVNALIVILEMGAVGIWYGISFRRNFPPMRALFGGVILAAASMIAVMLVSLWLSGTTLGSLAVYVEDYVNELVNTLNSTGMLDSMLGGVMTASEYTEQLISFLTELLPALLVVSAMLEAWICYALTAYVFRRLGFQVRNLPQFRDWHLPWVALWGMSIALLSYIGYHFLAVEWMKLLAFNILYIYGLLLTVMGVSLLIWYYKTFRAVWIIVLAVVMFLFAYNAVMWMLILAGLADCVLDFRAQAKAGDKKDKPPL